MDDGKDQVVALLVEPVVGEQGLAKSWRPRGNGRPPLAWKGPAGWDVSGPPYLQRVALPLWWDGRLVGMGWDIARRFLLDHTTPAQRDSDELGAILAVSRPTVDECRVAAEGLWRFGFATRVVELYRDEAAGLLERP